MRDLCRIFVLCASTFSILGANPAMKSNEDTPVPPVALPLPELEGAGLPGRVPQANQALSHSLAAFICDERIERYKGNLSGDKSYKIDTITSQLAFENGSEHYTEIFQNKRRRNQISALGGAWSQGEYGTLLQQTQHLFAVKPVTFRQKTVINDTPASIYSFDVDAGETPWELSVRAKIYKVPFRTYVWVAEDTAQILKIARVSKEIPGETGISKITWFVTLQPTDLGGQTFLVPRTGQYAVSYAQSEKSEWNSITFSNYHRFGSESSLSFNF